MENIQYYISSNQKPTNNGMCVKKEHTSQIKQEVWWGVLLVLESFRI